MKSVVKYKKISIPLSKLGKNNRLEPTRQSSNKCNCFFALNFLFGKIFLSYVKLTTTGLNLLYKKITCIGTNSSPAIC